MIPDYRGARLVMANPYRRQLQDSGGYGSPNTSIAEPEATATNCLPCEPNVIGDVRHD